MTHVVQESKLATAPYPGLRPFRDTEAEIFFGREEQTDQLLERLQRSHFIAVVGPSGCGKSSLVRAGMIASLETGFLVDAGADWRIAEMRPGERPLERLADALLAPSALDPERGSQASEVAIVRAMLRRGPLGLIEILQETPIPDNGNLLLLVDQFEEIFRFREEGSADEADAFVALLLATARQRDVPVYVVITMRSDFLGDSALFMGLPEAINEGQYLTPRLTRDQIRAAVSGPARVFGSGIEPELVNRLLNEIGPDPDQLPLLQHALMRMWTRLEARRGHYGADEAPGSAASDIVTLADYEAVGGLSNALSSHADQVLAELSESQRHLAKVMLTRLTEHRAAKGDTRRPARVDDIAAVAEVTPAQVIEIVEHFRRPDRSFLTPPPPVPINAETVLDICHESLIRQWHTLSAWADEEAASAARYRRLADDAELHANRQSGLLTDPALSFTLEWFKRSRPNAAWAARYKQGGFDRAEAFLRKSLQARQRNRWGLVAAMATVLVLSFLGLFKLEKNADSMKVLELRAQLERENKDSLQRLADAEISARRQAESARRQAESARRQAEHERTEADRQRVKAESLSKVFRSQKMAADANDLLTEPDGALSLAIEALSTARTPEAEAALQEALLGNRLLRRTPLQWGGGAVGSPDGKYVVIPDSPDSRNTVRVWSTALGKPAAGPFSMEEDIINAVFSPPGDLLGLVTEGGQVRIWETRDWRSLPMMKERLTGPPAISSDSKYLAARGADGRLWLWATSTGEKVAPIGSDSLGTSPAFSPDGRYIAFVHDGAAVLWSTGSRKSVKSFGDSIRRVEKVSFSPDGRQILTTARDSVARVWSVDRTREIATFAGSDSAGAPVQEAAYSPDGTLILTVGSSVIRTVGSSVIRIWHSPSDALLEPSSDEPIEMTEAGGIVSARFSRDNRWVVSTGSGDGSAKLWDVLTGDVVATFSGGGILSAWISEDSRRLLTTSSDSVLRLWDAIDFGAIKVLADLRGATTGLQYDHQFPARMSPNGKYLLATAADRVARLWETSTGSLKARLGDAQVPALSGVLSPNGRHAITFGQDMTVRVWDVERGMVSDSFGPGFPEAELAAGNFGDDTHPWAWYTRAQGNSTEATIHVRSMEDRKPYATRTRKDEEGGLICVTVSPDTRWMAMCQQREEERKRATGDGGQTNVIEVWPLPTGQAKLLRGHTGTLIDVFFSPDGRFAASTSHDKTAIVWEVGSWRAVGILAGHESAVTYAFFSSNTSRVGTIDEDHTVRVWDRQTGSLVAELRGHTDEVKAFEFSPSARWLVTGSHDKTVRVWDTRTGKALAVLHGHREPVIAVAFSPDSRTVVSAGADGTIRAYPCKACVSTSGLISLARERLKAIGHGGRATSTQP